MKSSRSWNWLAGGFGVAWLAATPVVLSQPAPAAVSSVAATNSLSMTVKVVDAASGRAIPNSAVLPTLAKIAQCTPPTQPIDGLDIRPLLAGQRGAESPHDALYFYWDDHLQAVRSGPWKLHFPHSYNKPAPIGQGGQPGKMTQPKLPLALYNLETDPSETTDLSADHPEVVARLQALAEAARKDLGDSATKTKGKGVREPGRLGS